MDNSTSTSAAQDAASGEAVGEQAFASLKACFWSDDRNEYVVVEIDSIDDTHPEYFEGEAELGYGDCQLVLDGDIDEATLLAEVRAAASLYMEDIVGFIHVPTSGDENVDLRARAWTSVGNMRAELGL